MTIITATDKKEQGVRLWAEGQAVEARRVWQGVLQEATEPNLRFALKNNLALAEWSLGNYEAALSIHLSTEPTLDNELLGNYHMGLGNVSQKLAHTEEDFDNALMHYTTALIHFERSGNTKHWSLTNNNIAFLLLKIERAEEALPYLDIARKNASDATSIAIIDDTLAQAYLKLNNIQLAIKCNSKSLSALIGTNERAAIEQAFKTQGEIKQRILGTG